jgi:hypothetical protein
MFEVVRLRRISALIVASIFIAACSGGSPSVDEYVESLNALVDEYSPRGEAMWLEYGENPSPTMDDLRELLDATAELRIEIDEALRDVEAPGQLAQSHEQWASWHSRLLEADRALASRAAAAANWDEYLGSAEVANWVEVLRQGSVICADYEARLNSTDAAELFAGAAWMPSDLTDVVHAAIGCDAFPEDIDDLSSIYGR